MKRILCIILSILMLLSLAACGEPEPDPEQLAFEAACALLEEGKYQEAIAAFSRLESYRKVQEKIDAAEAGLEAQWLTTSVTVRLRGETEVLKNLTAQDISVVVDFFGAEIGAQIYDAMILVDTDAVVGAIGDYEVYVSVQIRSPLAPIAYGTEG